MEKNKFYTKQTHLCQLEDGSIVPYDGAAFYEASDFYAADKWDFIGRGVIYSINGVLQNSTDLCWFYVRKSK